MVWARNAELIKKNFAHIRVEMLARMHQGFAQASGFGNGFRDDAGFDELWAGTDDGEDVLHMVNAAINYFGNAHWRACVEGGLGR